MSPLCLLHHLTLMRIPLSSNRSTQFPNSLLLDSSISGASKNGRIGKWNEYPLFFIHHFSPQKGRLDHNLTYRGGPLNRNSNCGAVPAEKMDASLQKWRHLTKRLIVLRFERTNVKAIKRGVNELLSALVLMSSMVFCGNDRQRNERGAELKSGEGQL